MAYALVQDIPASWNEYEHVAGVLDPAPPGLIIHVAGPTDEGIRIIAVWESEQAWRRFAAERLAEAISPLAESAGARRTFRDLHPVQIVVAPTQPVYADSPHPKEEQ